MLHRIIYHSVRQPGLTDADVVDGIVLPTLSKNRSLDVTGCIWVGRKRFVQVLEGDEETLRSLYDTICHDTRHHDIITIADGPLETRDFVRFAMKHIKGDDTDEIRALIDQFSPVIPSDRADEAEPKQKRGISQLIRLMMARSAV